jgi:hypothetical protein
MPVSAAMAPSILENPQSRCVHLLIASLQNWIPVRYITRTAFVDFQQELLS